MGTKAAGDETGDETGGVEGEGEVVEVEVAAAAAARALSRVVMMPERVVLPEPGMPPMAMSSRWFGGVDWYFSQALETRWST